MLSGGLKKVVSLLTPQEKKGLAGVFVLNFLTTIIDTMGILSLFPFLQIVMKPEIIHQNKWLSLIYTTLGFTSDRNFHIIAGISLMIIFILANALKGYTLWWSNQYVYDCNRTVSTKLLRIYFGESYLENIKKNSAQVASHLLTNVDLGIASILNAWIGLFSSSLLVLFLLIILFVTQPGSALITLFGVGTFYYFLDRSIKHQLGDLGQKVIKNSAHLYKNLNESTGGVKEIKYLGREEKFLNDYNDTYKEYVDLKSKNNLYQFMPKLLVDTLAFCVGIIVIVFILGAEGNLTNSIPWMGLFAFIILRLVPNTQVILQQISKLRFSSNALSLIHNDYERYGKFTNQAKTNPTAIAFQHTFEFKNVSFAYTPTGINVLNDISFSIKRGEMVAFVGKTGAGKTTLIDILLGLITQQVGQIKIDGKELVFEEIYRWQKNVGYVPQFVFLADDNITNNVAFGIPEKDIQVDRVIEACKKANIHDFITDKLNLGYNTVIGERGVQLSGGQRQRLGIARALYHDADFIILDEATSALDNQTEINVMEEINKIAGIKTIIIIAHRLSTVKKCDKIFLLENGSLLSSGSFQEMVTKEPEFFNKVH